jgi:IS5 family transposase
LSPDHNFWLATRGRSIQKCQFGYRKVRYRGIAKNGAQVFSLLALANLYLARRTLASA